MFLPLFASTVVEELGEVARLITFISRWLLRLLIGDGFQEDLVLLSPQHLLIRRSIPLDNLTFPLMMVSGSIKS